MSRFVLCRPCRGLNGLLPCPHSLRSGPLPDAPPALENQTRCFSISALANESVFGRFDWMSGSLTREIFRAVIFNFTFLRCNFIEWAARLTI